jgi:molybdopterin synthase sulfur carrier subunit
VAADASSAVRVRIPTQLRQLTGGANEVDIEVAGEGATVAEVLKGLDAAHAGFGERLFDEAGQLRRFVNVFVADEDVRFLQGLETPVVAGQVVSIVPAVAGG